MGARGNVIFWPAYFSRMAAIYGRTRQGWTLSVCILHADFWSATLHVRGLHRHTDPGLDACAFILGVFYWNRIHRRRDRHREQNTSATGSRVARSHVSFVD